MKNSQETEQIGKFIPEVLQIVGKMSEIIKCIWFLEEVKE